jgi:beta-hydroxylase
MFLDADRHPVARTLEDHWLEIREEMRALRREDYESIADPLIVQGCWVGLGVFDSLDPMRAHRWRHNAAACPRTVAVLSRIEGLQVSAFLLMTPATRLCPHRDMQDPRFLNFLIALDGGSDAWMRVGAERRVHANGRCVVFDPREEHEAGNDGPQDRVALFAAVGFDAARCPARPSGS